MGASPLLSESLLLVAKARLLEEKARSEANLRRATSDLYYCLFHAVCEAAVSSIKMDTADPEYPEVYQTVYRQADHGTIERRCNFLASNGLFAADMRRFAKHFITMKNKRELADYAPLERFEISAVKNDCATTETVLRLFQTTTEGQRTKFALDVVFTPRKGRAKG